MWFLEPSLQPDSDSGISYLFGGAMVGLYPRVKAFKYQRKEGLYYTLMMSIGLSHGVIDQAQYSYLVATVIGSAVVPTMFANAWFMPRHVLPRIEHETSMKEVSTASTN